MENDRPKLEPEYLTGSTKVQNTKKKSCFWGHDWSNWQQYSVQVYSRWHKTHGYEDRQKRRCLRCNKVEDKYVT